MRLPIFTTIIILLLILILPLLLLQGIRQLPNGFQPPNNFIYYIYQKQNVFQKFTPSQNNLSAIGLSIKNLNLSYKDNVNLNLYDDQGALIQQISKSAAYISDGDFVRFDISPIADSMNKHYSFEVSAPAAESANALGVFYVVEPAGTTPGQLSYLEFYKPSSRFAIIRLVYSQWWAKIMADPIFFVFYLLLIGGLLIGTLRPSVLTKFQLGRSRKPDAN